MAGISDDRQLVPTILIDCWTTTRPRVRILPRLVGFSGDN